MVYFGELFHVNLEESISTVEHLWSTFSVRCGGLVLVRSTMFTDFPALLGLSITDRGPLKSLERTAKRKWLSCCASRFDVR